MTKRISMWSGPRNVSTAIMYSFAQRHDTKVMDEPLYGYYLNHHPTAAAYHPGASSVMSSMSSDYKEVVKSLTTSTQAPVMFYKNMAHHLYESDLTWLKDVKNVILMRDPKELILSFSKVIDQPTIQDIGFLHLKRLVDYLEGECIDYIAIDSKRFLQDHQGQLMHLCDWLGISFDEAMLSWEAGARVEDGVWAPYWYSNVHRSTGFQPYSPKKEELPASLMRLYEECMPYYQELLKKVL